MDNPIIQNPEKPSLKFSESQFIFADSNFFNFFSFNLLQGNEEKILTQPYTVVISQQAAKKYFGTLEVVGKTIRYNNAYNFIISGIADNAPSNSTITYDFVASLASIASMKETRNLIADDRSDFTTYFTIKPETTIDRVENALAQLAKQREGSEFSSRYIGVPMKEYHSVSGVYTGAAKYIKMFPFVAALVLLLALINYMSLSTAGSCTRAREIGVRKVMGASRSIIATQFFIESILYVSISFVLAYILCVALQPAFFSFLQINIDRSFLYAPVSIISFLLLFIITVIISSLYLALFLSAFKPLAVLYGKLTRGGNLGVRKFFTVFQFTIAAVFIICGIIIQKQIHYFKTADTGIDRENVVMIPFGNNVALHAASFKQAANSIAGVQQTSLSLHQDDMAGGIILNKCSANKSVLASNVQWV